MSNDYPRREFYVGLFKEMSTAILAAQRADGFWYPSLKDAQHIPLPETSGTAFFVFGLTWGVRNGLLDHELYWPAVVRGWRALLTRINPDGAVLSVQPIGFEPADFEPNSSFPYGTGAVLMAGSEILRALGEAAMIEPAMLLERAEMVLEVPNISTRVLARE